MQPAVEAHIVAAVGFNEAPAEWGCDALWQGGEVDYERCVAVFAIGYTIDEVAAPPSYLNELLGHAPSVVGEEVAFPAPVLDMSRLLPSNTSYFAYVGSLVRFCLTLLQPFASSDTLYTKHSEHCDTWYTICCQW